MTMALITDREAPPEVPSTDALKDIPADLLGPIPAEVRLGQNVLMMMDRPPELGDTVTVVCRLRITREGKEKASGDAEGEIRHFRGGKIVASWLQGTPEPPDPEALQPALFGEGSEPDDGDNVNGVVDRPGFSSAE